MKKLLIIFYIQGIEVTPKWAGNMSRYQIHITADISYSLRQYLYATHDVGILKSDLGLDLALEIARYWKSRTTKTGNDVYEILGESAMFKYCKTFSHWRSSHYTVTHVCNKNSNNQGRSPW